MIGGEAVELRHQGGAAAVGDLVGVEFHRQVVGARCFEHATGLRRGEADGFAKGINGVDKAFAGQGRQDLIANQVDIIVGASVIFGGDGVGAKESAADIDAGADAGLGGGDELFSFSLQIKAVAGFYFQRCNALADHMINTDKGRLEQARLICRPRCRDR